jgi:hypothetical protein
MEGVGKGDKRKFLSTAFGKKLKKALAFQV